MRLVSLLGLVALLPAALNAAPPAAGLAVPLCTGDGAVRSITLPIDPASPSRRDEDGCCVKGCHTGSSRKRGSCHI